MKRIAVACVAGLALLLLWSTVAGQEPEQLPDSPEAIVMTVACGLDHRASLLNAFEGQVTTTWLGGPTGPRKGNGTPVRDLGVTRFYSMDGTTGRYLEEVRWYGDDHPAPGNHQLRISADGQGQQRNVVAEHPADASPDTSQRWEDALLAGVLVLTTTVKPSWAALVERWPVLLCEEDMLGDTAAIHIELQVTDHSGSVTHRRSLWVDVERGFALLQHGFVAYQGLERTYGTVVRASDLLQVGDDLWLPQRSVSMRYEGPGPLAETWMYVVTHTLADVSVNEATNGEVIDLLASGATVAESGYEVRLSDDNTEEVTRRKSIAEVLAASAAGEKPELLPIPSIEIEVQGSTAR